MQAGTPCCQAIFDILIFSCRMFGQGYFNCELRREALLIERDLAALCSFTAASIDCPH